MRVLISSFSFPPNKDGVSEAAATMAAGFLAQGWNVDIATTPHNPPRKSLTWHGAMIHEFSIAGDEHPKHDYRGDVGRYRDFILAGGWDVIVFHAYLWSLYVPLHLLERISAKKIVVSHGFAALQWVRAKTFPWGLWVWAFWIYRSLEMTRWLRKIDRTVYLSHLADFRGFFDHKIAQMVNYPGIRVIPNGIDPDLRGTDPGAFRNAHGVRHEQILFLCVANYSRRKDQGYAARAFRAAGLEDAVIVFIGSDFNGDAERFRSEDDALPDHEKTGRVIWLEKIDRASTLDALAACDVFVLSADHEAQPIAILEAMREGKPWVARDAGCISEFPGGVCVRSEQAMSAEMARLAADAVLRLRLGTEGRAAIVSTYNRQKYVDSYRTLVTEVTGT